MKIVIIIISFLIIFYIFYKIYFKEYNEVVGNMETLKKVLDTRNLLLMRILPELKEEKLKAEAVKLIQGQLESKKMGYDKFIECDVKLNKHLKKIYPEIDKIKNVIVKEEFKKIILLEKKLKVIRKEYTNSVDKYNNNLLKHKKLYFKYLRMKPLNDYKVK